MASDKTTNWCHLHEQRATECQHHLCEIRADDPTYADFASEPDAIEGLTSLGMAAGSLHEIYWTNRNAGFGPRQALWLVAVAMTGNPGPAPDSDEPESN